MPFINKTQATNLGKSTVSLGYHPDTEDSFIIPHKDRYAGTYILGVQGTGKSGLLENLIIQDINNGQAVIVIDPHGDLIVRCIGRLPEEKLSKTFLLDMEDVVYPFGVNIFGPPKQGSAIALTQAVDRVMHVFEVLWGDILSQAYLPRYLRAATIVLLDSPGSTLVDMHSLLTDDVVRHRMLQAVKDETVRQFWRSQYDELSPSLRLQRVEPLIGRLESLFMGRRLVRNIVGQRVTSINFRRAIEDKEIIFIRLPIKTLTQDARLIGTFLVSQIHQAIFSFSDMPEEKRPGLSLYIDEAQHFTTPDFAEMFSEGRKFGIRAVLAHQYRSQLPAYLQAATMTARTKVCFQITPEDSREMAHLFLNGETTIKAEDIDPRPVEYLLKYGSDNDDVKMFIEYYLRPLQQQKQGNIVEIRKPGLQVRQVPFLLLNVPSSKEKPRVPDPTPYLNHLLYEVMKTSNPSVPIPSEVVWGFSNCGKSFYAEFPLGLIGKFLRADVSYPAYLVVNERWTRAPETGKEQLYHFVFHLRKVMEHLAHHSIGRKSTLGSSEVARMLTSLPKRAAFVRSGDEVGVIYTDAIPPVDAALIRKRMYIIRGQTRQKYCHPPTTDDTIQVPAIKPLRWEEVQ